MKFFQIGMERTRKENAIRKEEEMWYKSCFPNGVNMLFVF
jgi:hypothetical protein